MKLKTQVLEYLQNKRGEIVSGEQIAKSFGVTRNSIWKAINALKKEGYDIASQSNMGYVFFNDNDVFNAHSIEALCKSNINVVVLDCVASTNDVAKKMAQDGANEGTVVIAKAQSAGKGRSGRSFISNEENGLYMSIILRPKFPASMSVKITVIGAVATLEAIEETSGRQCSIKWVNDIYIKDKKVCGILTEGALNFESGMLDYAILGIGVNIVPPKNGFDKEIKSIATAIYDEAPKGYKNELCAKIIDRFLYYYENAENNAYIHLYRNKSNIVGKRVSVYRGNNVLDGVAIDIDNEANLIVQTKNGIMKFNSGEARVRRDEQ